MVTNRQDLFLRTPTQKGLGWNRRDLKLLTQVQKISVLIESEVINSKILNATDSKLSVSGTDSKLSAESTDTKSELEGGF